MSSHQQPEEVSEDMEVLIRRISAALIHQEKLEKYVKRFADSIIRVAAYHRHDFDRQVARIPKDETNVIQSSIFQKFETPPAALAGPFRLLPPEIFAIIFEDVDLLTAFRFSQVNRAARAMMANNRKFGCLAKHAANCIGVLLRTKLAQTTKIHTLYNTMCTKYCDFCVGPGILCKPGCTVCPGVGFAGFISLLTLTRCCFRCVMRSRISHKYVPKNIWKAMDVADMDELRQVYPIMQTMVGSYGWALVKRGRRANLATPTTLAALMEAIGRSYDDIKHPSVPFNKYRIVASMPYYDPITGSTENGLCCKGCYYISNPLTEPARGPQLREPDSTFMNGPCKDFAREKVYSREGYLAHFKTCKPSQKLWELSEQGKGEIDDEEFITRGGWYGED